MADDIRGQGGEIISREAKDLLAKKLELRTQLRTIRAEMAKLDERLLDAGVESSMIACW